jgi:hypothetical protein
MVRSDSMSIRASYFRMLSHRYCFVLQPLLRAGSRDGGAILLRWKELWNVGRSPLHHVPITIAVVFGSLLRRDFVALYQIFVSCFQMDSEEVSRPRY